VWPAQYEEPPHLEPEEAEAILAAGIGETDTDEASAVLIGLVLFDNDRAFVEHWCVRLGRKSKRSSVAGIGGTCSRSSRSRLPDARA
jgi:hypothetical protein